MDKRRSVWEKGKLEAGVGWRYEEIEVRHYFFKFSAYCLNQPQTKGCVNMYTIQRNIVYIAIPFKYKKKKKKKKQEIGVKYMHDMFFDKITWCLDGIMLASIVGCARDNFQA
jgi:hypothetical protein